MHYIGMPLSYLGSSFSSSLWTGSSPYNTYLSTLRAVLRSLSGEQGEDVRVGLASDDIGMHTPVYKYTSLPTLRCAPNRKESVCKRLS